MQKYLASILLGLAILGTSFVSSLLLISSGGHSMSHGMDVVCVAHCIAEIQETNQTSMVVTVWLGVVFVVGFFSIAPQQGSAPTLALIQAFGRPPDPRLLLTVIKRD